MANLVLAQSPSADQIIRALTPTDPPRVSRGIHLVEPEPSETATPGQATAFRTPALNLTVNFVSGSADLSLSAMRTLDELGQAMSSTSLARYRFRIEGHTDTVGLPDMNKILSKRRAAAVVDYLALTWGVDRAKVEAVGMGQEELVVPTGPNVAQPRNRRVTVINLGG